MISDILHEITTNKFLIILMNENEYTNKLKEIVESVDKDNTRICYVCLNKPYSYVVEDLKSRGVDTKNFFFLDILTSHYGKPEPADNCVFLESPLNLDELKKAVDGIVRDSGCEVILFDTFSTLLIYHRSFSLMKFAHNMKSEKLQEETRKLFIVLKEDMLSANEGGFAKDLEMFADKNIEISCK